MIDKIKEKLKWAFTTKLGLAVTAIIWVMFWGIINKITDTDWSHNVASIGVLFIVAFIILLVLHGWVINPIRSIINKRKNKN